jgi:hypothetical protein
LLDDCYVLSARGNDIVLWGEAIPARGEDLSAALRNGNIHDIQLDSPRPKSNSRGDWRINISVSLITGILHIGIDEQYVHNSTALLRRASEIAKRLFNIRYGIAYKMPLAHKPDCYASGNTKRHTSITEVLDEFRARHEGSYKKTADDLWSDELSGQRRHLTGLFRGAYPANILSEAHVRSAALMSRGIGKLTEFDNSLWLWELSGEEIPVAQSILESRGVLVSQASASR